MTMRKALLTTLAVGLSAGASAQDKPVAVDPARVEAAVAAGWRNAAPAWKERLVPDETMKACSASGNHPSPAEFEVIQSRERARIEYPPDGKLVGDWKKGEAVAQSGFGLRFTDYPATRANGGNCYACHQLTAKEVSYGTIGPSLLGYGRIRSFGAEDIKAVYEKIFDPHATQACSLMPRFGANKVLTVEQIKDVVALLMDPDSPVNK